MGVATETYAELEATLLAAIAHWHEGGPEPVGWTLTTEMYRQLDYPGEAYEHFRTSARAIFYGEAPKDLYQLPVRLQVGSSHIWSLSFARKAG